jgi:hypothetical protein
MKDNEAFRVAKNVFKKKNVYCSDYPLRCSFLIEVISGTELCSEQPDAAEGANALR